MVDGNEMPKRYFVESLEFELNRDISMKTSLFNFNIILSHKLHRVNIGVKSAKQG